MGFVVAYRESCSLRIKSFYDKSAKTRIFSSLRSVHIKISPSFWRGTQMYLILSAGRISAFDFTFFVSINSFVFYGHFHSLVRTN